MPDGGPFGPASVVVFGLASAVAWGAGDFGGGLVARRLSVFVLVFFTQTTGMVAALLLALLRGEPAPGPADIGWSVLAGLLGAGAIVALYAGLAQGRMGVVAPVTGVLAATVPVVAGIVLEGVPGSIVVAGIVAAILAVVLVSRVPGETDGPSGLELALVAGVLIGLFSVAITRVDEALVFGPLTIARLSSSLGVVAVLVTTRRRPTVPGRLLPAIVAIGLLDMGGNASFLFAEKTGPLAVASVLSSLYPVTTVILAAVVLRERVTRSHAAGISLAVAAIVLITIGAA